MDWLMKTGLLGAEQLAKIVPDTISVPLVYDAIVRSRARRFSSILVVGVLFAVTPQSGFAETYMGIQPLATLGEVQALFPQAQFRRSKPAWAKAKDVLYEITGSGISGSIVVIFNDSRPMWRERLDEALAHDMPQSDIDRIREEYDRPETEALRALSVRWVPTTPVPLKRLVSKYGPPEKSGIREDDFQPYREWGKRGVTAYLRDDEQSVVYIEFAFTREDISRAASGSR